MRIDLSAENSWLQVCDACRAALPFQDPRVQVQAYVGYRHALMEATQGIARLFSHKKTIAFVASSEPAVDEVAIAFAEDGYAVRALTSADLDDPQSAWLTPIQNELLFVIFPEDDPVTGRIYDHSRLHAALKDKRVFRISISHASYKAQELAPPTAFEIRILSLAPDFAAVIAGERFRAQPTLAPKLPWDLERAHTSLKHLAPLSQDLKLIVDFEAKLPPGFQAYFPQDEARVADRAVISTIEFDGSAVIDLVAKEMGWKLGDPGQTSPLESMSACRWKNPRLSDWLLARGETEEILRGLIVIDAQYLSPTLASRLRAAAEKLRALQSGES